MDRRSVLKGSLTAAGATALTAGATAMAGDRPVSQSRLSSGKLGAGDLDPLQMPLHNRDQAQVVMEEYDLQGMIALNPVNVYYLTNTIPLVTKMRFQYPAFATLARDPEQPTFLITSIAQLWDIANGDRWTPDIITFTGARNSSEYQGENAKPLSEEPTAGQFAYAVTDTEELSDREQRWADSQLNHQPSPGPEWAVARALKESGITSGRVAIDDMRIAYLLNRIEATKNIEFVEGDSHFRRIRYIKSKNEIDLMAAAAKNNAEAAVAVAQSIEKGMLYSDIERAFLAESAIRGNVMAFIIAGISMGGPPNGAVEEGEPFLIDAVSHFQQYHGDFARTVILGEPKKHISKIVNAQAVAREAIFEMLKPGVTFSKIREVGKDAFKKAGGDPSTFFVNPHSVGLQHTDQPYDVNNPWRGGEDITVQKGMTITVDLPYIEVGIGAGHHEDLLLITENGFEPLTDSYPDILSV